jgi:hypothetical protein
VALGAAALLSAPAARAAEEITSLPEGAGREETFYGCTSCHGVELIRRQSLNRDGWEDMITLMVARHGMPEPPTDERRLIVDYLAQHFPVRQGTGWRNPFLR